MAWPPPYPSGPLSPPPSHGKEFTSYAVFVLHTLENFGNLSTYNLLSLHHLLPSRLLILLPWPPALSRYRDPPQTLNSPTNSATSREGDQQRIVFQFYSNSISNVNIFFTFTSTKSPSNSISNFFHLP
ncbi:protein farnesyltransferase subunit beta [Iris pallida]|uniref:Protein farnesyltransferase subunit beta n=1 Tax=Iris pallida TaxID=29817 RepID=A0AAX6GN49_IRIPA|nr:protein farnesyltransferase subunit beta [Iris pallida]